MTDELLIIGEIETKGISLTADKLDLVGFCQELITEFTQTYPNYQFQFESNIACLETECDSRLLRSILTNILTNAVKYSACDRAIRFKLTTSKKGVIFTIQDYGVGIPQEDLKYIFEPFHRGKNVSNIPGTGLGLNIVKTFIAFLNGEIEIISQLNRGTKVKITISLTRNL